MTGSEFLSEGSKVLCEATGVKPMVRWRFQEVRDAQNMECLPQKATDSEQYQPKKEAVWFATRKPTEMESPKPSEAHISLLPMYLRCWTWRYRV